MIMTDSHNLLILQLSSISNGSKATLIECIDVNCDDAKGNDTIKDNRIKIEVSRSHIPNVSFYSN